MLMKVQDIERLSKSFWSHGLEWCWKHKTCEVI